MKGKGGGRRPRGATALLGLALLAGAGCGEAPGSRAQESEGGASVTPGARRGGAGGITVDPATGQVVRTQTIRVGGVPMTVEIADTPELRSRGLMHRDSLPEDHGMLFVYPEPGLLSFWMRNTSIPLDIAFLDANGVIVNIERMEPHTDTQHVARAPALYALETRQGWFAEHGVEPGERVEF